MSYILQALKKSDEKRKRGNVPDIQTVHAPSSMEFRRYPFLPYLIAAVVLAGGTALILLAIFRPWRAEMPPVSAGPATSENTAYVPAGQEQADNRRSLRVSPADPPVAARAKLAEKSAVGPADEKSVSQTAVSPVETETQVSSEQKNESSLSEPAEETGRIGSLAIQNEQAVVTEPAFGEPLLQNALAALDKDRIYNLKELPASIQKELPDLTISAFLYSSDPGSRLVRISDNLLREGDKMTSDLKLEKITSEGLIFLYRDIRFKVGLD